MGKATSGHNDHFPPDGDNSEQQALAAEFPEWRLWRSRGPNGEPCALMATRRRTLTGMEMNAGLARTLPMGYFGDLRKQLAEQAEREDTLRDDRR
jgi:hypothetical protein